jgi:hypothetical protein
LRPRLRLWWWQAPPTRRRAELRERLETAQAAPRPFDEAVADLDKLVAALAERARPPATWVAQSAGGWQDLLVELAPSLGAESDRADVPPAALLAAVAPDGCRAWLERELRASYARLPAPFPAAERVRQLAEPRKHLAAVEAERAIRAKLVETGSTGALPDTSREFGSLSKYESVLSSWNWRLLAEGPLDP